MSSRETQIGSDLRFDTGHPLFDELMDIVDEENMTVSRLRDILDKCLTLGADGKTPEDVMYARGQFSKFVEILEHRETNAERKTLEKEGKLIELSKRLPPSDFKAAYGKMATVTPLFKKEAPIETIVEPAVIAQSVEKPRRNHLRLIK